MSGTTVDPAERELRLSIALSREQTELRDYGVGWFEFASSGDGAG